MRAFRTLLRRELGSFFNAWSGYIVIAAVLFLIGLCFASVLRALNAAPTDRPVTELFYDTYYFWLILLLAAPLITMRSFALEKATGTFETLMTTPVSDAVVVLAKFAGAMVFYALMWVPLVGYSLIVHRFSNDPAALNPGVLGGTMAGVLLLGMLYMALGCFASALTKSQIIAAVISFAFGFSLFVLSLLSAAFTGQDGWQADVLGYVALTEHMRDFSRGIVDTRPVVFYLSLTVLFLMLTLKVVESRRWK